MHAGERVHCTTGGLMMCTEGCVCGEVRCVRFGRGPVRASPANDRAVPAPQSRARCQRSGESRSRVWVPFVRSRYMLVCPELSAVLPHSQCRACVSRAYLNFEICAGWIVESSVLKLGNSCTPETMETFGAARPRLFSRSHVMTGRERNFPSSQRLFQFGVLFRCCFLI